MAKWKENIKKITGKNEAEREAAFEQAAMAELSELNPKQPTPSPKPAPPPPALPGIDSISISITENGRTTTYSDLASVPLTLRQRILFAWLSKPIS